MSETTKIAWATSTGSPWFGCSEVSLGCSNCYARELTLRHHWAGWGNVWPRIRSKGFWSMARKLDKQASVRSFLKNPPPRPRMFPSLMDWLDINASVELLGEFLDLIRTTPNLDWLLLTKRPQWFNERLAAVQDWDFDHGSRCLAGWVRDWWKGMAAPPSNVWVGVSVENQDAAEERIPRLMAIPAAVRFLSCEPLLEKIDLRGLCADEAMGVHWNCLTGYRDWQCDTNPGPHVDWVIIGGESGQRRRDCGVEAITNLERQCVEAGVACFVKQDCAEKPGQQGRIPDDYWRVKQFPTVRHL